MRVAIVNSAQISVIVAGEELQRIVERAAAEHGDVIVIANNVGVLAGTGQSVTEVFRAIVIVIACDFVGLATVTFGITGVYRTNIVVITILGLGRTGSIAGAERKRTWVGCHECGTVLVLGTNALFRWIDGRIQTPNIRYTDVVRATVSVLTGIDHMVTDPIYTEVE